MAKGRSDEERLVTDMTELARQYGRYGYRRVHWLLEQEGWQVRVERVKRIWRCEGLKVPRKGSNLRPMAGKPLEYLPTSGPLGLVPDRREPWILKKTRAILMLPLSV